MSEPIQAEIRFKSATEVSTAEIALLESILPEILQAMILAEDEKETD